MCTSCMGGISVHCPRSQSLHILNLQPHPHPHPTNSATNTSGSVHCTRTVPVPELSSKPMRPLTPSPNNTQAAHHRSQPTPTQQRHVPTHTAKRHQTCQTMSGRGTTKLPTADKPRKSCSRSPSHTGCHGTCTLRAATQAGPQQLDFQVPTQLVGWGCKGLEACLGLDALEAGVLWCKRTADMSTGHVTLLHNSALFDEIQQQQCKVDWGRISYCAVMCLRAMSTASKLQINCQQNRSVADTPPTYPYHKSKTRVRLCSPCHPP